MPRRPLLPLLLAIAFVSACDGQDSGPVQVRENAFVWGSPAAAGDRIVLRDFAGDIVVTPSADDTVRVTAKLEWRRGDPDKDMHFQGSRSGTDMLICAIWGDGKCTVDDYTANFKGRSGAGVKAHFTVQAPAGVKVFVSNMSGDVTVQASAPVEATTMDGDVLVVTAVGPVKGETMNGSVDVRMSSLAAGADSVVAKTINGDAFIYLPALDDARVDLGVMNGSVASAFASSGAPSERTKKLQFTAGAGTRPIVAYSLNGDVALRQLDAAGRAP